MHMKREYATPTISRIGSFEDITQQTSTGASLDAAIPSGTPIDQIPGFVAGHLS